MIGRSVSARHYPLGCALVSSLLVRSAIPKYFGIEHRYTLSYRDLEEMMVERGVSLVHTTIYRWVQRYGPELDERCRRHLRPTNDAWKIDETYLKVKGEHRYLWRAIDSAGNTLALLNDGMKESGRMLENGS